MLVLSSGVTAMKRLHSGTPASFSEWMLVGLPTMVIRFMNVSWLMSLMSESISTTS